jgi:hypothetical protein
VLRAILSRLATFLLLALFASVAVSCSTPSSRGPAHSGTPAVGTGAGSPTTTSNAATTSRLGTTTVPVLELGVGSNGRSYSVAVGTRIDVRLEPDPQRWSAIEVGGSPGVLRETGRADQPDGSAAVDLLAAEPGSGRVYATHPCANQPAGYCTATLAFSVGIDVS